MSLRARHKGCRCGLALSLANSSELRAGQEEKTPTIFSRAKSRSRSSFKTIGVTSKYVHLLVKLSSQFGALDFSSCLHFPLARMLSMGRENSPPSIFR